MTKLLTGIIILFVFGTALLLKSYSDHERLFSLVSWCVSGKSITLSNDIYTDLFSPALFELIPSEYRIDTMESSQRSDISVIEEAFHLYLSKQYFNNNLKKDRDFLSLSEQQYYMLSLNNFLHKNMCSKTFEEKDMVCTTSTEYHGEYPNSWLVTTHSLTDFGVVYYKLLYASEVFCENADKKQKPFRNFIGCSITIKDYISSRSVQTESIRW